MKTIRNMGRVAVLGLGLAAALTSCRMRDIRTVIVRAPGVKNEACRAIVANALHGAEGVDGSTIRFGDGTVTVTYDSMKTAIMNIEHTIADAGFAAGDLPANAEAQAALPAECR